MPQGRIVRSRVRPWVLGQPIFRYVDLAHAEAVESGSIKIGTLRSFAALESVRADPDEGRVTYTSDILRSGERNFEAAAARCGVYVEDSYGIVIDNSEATWVSENQYCVCTSYRGDLPDNGNKQAVFEIKNAEAFASRLSSILEPIRTAVIGPVDYGTRERDARQPLDTHPAFLKPLSFASEHEVRLLFGGPLGDDTAPIITAADIELASLMVRVR